MKSTLSTYQEKPPAAAGGFSVSKKSPKGGFFGKMEKGDKRCTREKEMDDEK